MAIDNQIVLSSKETMQLLYYETGFTQLHPKHEIYNWMLEQGHTYKVDWFVHHYPSIDHGELPYYILEFTSKEMMTLFALKWLGQDGKQN